MLALSALHNFIRKHSTVHELSTWESRQESEQEESTGLEVERDGHQEDISMINLRDKIAQDMWNSYCIYNR